MAKTSIKEFEKDLNLSHFTFENLHEAVFWVNAHGNIIYVNDAACRMSGYSKEDFTRMQVKDINPSDIVSDFPAFWKKLKEKKHFTFDAKHKHKNGYVYDVEITGNFIEYKGEDTPAVLYGIPGGANGKKNCCEPFPKPHRAWWARIFLKRSPVTLPFRLASKPASLQNVRILIKQGYVRFLTLRTINGKRILNTMWKVRPVSW